MTRKKKEGAKPKALPKHHVYKLTAMARKASDDAQLAEAREAREAEAQLAEAREFRAEAREAEAREAESQYCTPSRCDGRPSDAAEYRAFTAAFESAFDLANDLNCGGWLKYSDDELENAWQAYRKSTSNPWGI